MAPTSPGVKAKVLPEAAKRLHDLRVTSLPWLSPLSLFSPSDHTGLLAALQTHQAFLIPAASLLRQGAIHEGAESLRVLALTLITISKVKTPVKT